MITALILSASTMFSMPYSVDSFSGFGVSVAKGFSQQGIKQSAVYLAPEVSRAIAQGLGSNAVGHIGAFVTPM